MADDATTRAPRLDDEGFLEFRIVPRRAASKLAVATLVAVLPVVVAALVRQPLLSVLGVLWFLWIGVAAGALYAEQLLGAGVPLRLDHDGLTVRRWGSPLRLRWSDVLALGAFERGQQRRDQVTLYMSQWVWHDYMAARPGGLRLVDRLSHYSRRIVLLDIFDVPAADIIEFAGPDRLAQLTTLAAPYRLVLDIGEDGQSPLWLRGGREAQMDEVPLSPRTKQDIHAWNRRLLALADRDQIDDSFGAEAEDLTEAGRSLALRIRSELGADAEVLPSPDVPRS